MLPLVLTKSKVLPKVDEVKAVLPLMVPAVCVIEPPEPTAASM